MVRAHVENRFGYPLLEGVGAALLIPPVYILITVAFLDLPSRAKSFGIVSAAGGIGAAAGTLICGLITSTISWRASLIVQVLALITVVAIACIGLIAALLLPAEQTAT